MNADSLITTASIMSGFGGTVLVFRLNRELPMKIRWIPWADYLVLCAINISLLIVVLPLSIATIPGNRVIALASAGCASSAILLAAYPLAILSHYRIGIGARREGPTEQGEPVEKIIVIVASIIAAGIFGFLIAYRLCSKS